MAKKIKGKDPEDWINEKVEGDVLIGPDTSVVLAILAVNDLRPCILRDAAQAYLLARDVFEGLLNECGMNYEA